MSKLVGVISYTIPELIEEVAKQEKAGNTAEGMIAYALDGYPCLDFVQIICTSYMPEVIEKYKAKASECGVSVTADIVMPVPEGEEPTIDLDQEFDLEMDALVAGYEKRFGKAPPKNMKKETIAKRLQEAEQNEAE